MRACEHELVIVLKFSLENLEENHQNGIVKQDDFEMFRNKSAFSFESSTLSVIQFHSLDKRRENNFRDTRDTRRFAHCSARGIQVFRGSLKLWRGFAHRQGASGNFASVPQFDRWKPRAKGSMPVNKKGNENDVNKGMHTRRTFSGRHTSGVTRFIVLP